MVIVSTIPSFYADCERIRYMDQAISSFLQHLIVEKGFSSNTSQAYRNDLSQFWSFLQERQNGNGSGNGHYHWGSVGLDTLNEYIVDLRGPKGYRDTTTARKVAAIRSFFGFLFENGAISADPTESLGSPRVGRSLPKYLFKEEVASLLASAYETGGNEAQRCRVEPKLGRKNEQVHPYQRDRVIAVCLGISK